VVVSPGRSVVVAGFDPHPARNNTPTSHNDRTRLVMG
jgi:hypothetical protein